jgi:hypothetical protein
MHNQLSMISVREKNVWSYRQWQRQLPAKEAPIEEEQPGEARLRRARALSPGDQ